MKFLVSLEYILYNRILTTMCQINLNKSPNAKQLLEYNNSIEKKLSNKMK